MQLLTCRCGDDFIGEMILERRTFIESHEAMLKAGRDNKKRIGTELLPVCPALCEECRKLPPMLPFRTDWESD